MPLKSNSQMHSHMRTVLLVVLVAALSLSALLLAGGASAQRPPGQGNDNASGGRTKRVIVGRGNESGQGSRVTVTADDSLKDYSAYRSGDRFYVVLPKSAAGARGGGSGRGYSDMQVQQRGDSVVLSYRVQPGAKPRVEQKFNRLDVVFDVPGEGGQQPAANNAARQQQQPQTPPAGNRNPPAQQNNQTQAAASTTSANAGPERRQPSAEETARTQAANAAAANTTQPAANAVQPPAGVDPAAQTSAATSAGPTQEPAPTATPAAEPPQLARAQQPAPIAPITTNQPAAATQSGRSLGTYLVQNWWLALVIAMVVGLGLILAARRTAAATPAPVEGLDEGSAAKLDEPRALRAKEVSARALKDASAAAQASTLDTAKASTLDTAKASAVVAPEPVVKTEPVISTETVGTTEPVGAAEPVSTAETVKTAEASGAGLKPLAAATALAGGAAVAKSRKQSRKESRQEVRRKKKGGRADETKGARAAETVAESTVATPVVEEPAVEEQTVAPPVAAETAAAEPVSEETLVHEETLVEAPAVEETPAAETSFVEQAEAPAEVEETAVEEVAQTETAVAEVLQEEPVEVAPAPSAEEVAEVSTEPEAAEHFAAPAVETAEPVEAELAAPGFEATVPSFDTSEVETTEIASVEAEPVEPSVADEPVVAVTDEPVGAEAPAPVAEIEPAFAPEPERVLDETRHLLEGEEYDRAVVGSRDSMARQMVAAELLSALAGRNALRRERASAAFVEHGYFEETSRDLREADAPAERSAAARAFAHLGDRKATPLLVAALADPVTDVRRAAVEALGALRDPSAVEALEALLERERTERNRIPPRVIRNAVDSCREGFAEAPAAEPRAETPTLETQSVVAAGETHEPAPSFEPEAATAEVAAVEDVAVENAPEPFAGVAAPGVTEAAPDVSEETSVSIAPLVAETAEEPINAPEPAAEATGETAHVPEPVLAEEAFDTVAQTGVEPYVEPERSFVGHEEEAAEAREEVAAGGAEEAGIQPFVGQEEEVTAEGTFDFTSEARESEQATLFDASAEEVTREFEPAAAESSKELTPSTSEAAAGEWFDFDISEMGGGTQPTASAASTSETVAPEPRAPEPVFELSSGETFTAPAAEGAEPAAAEVEEVAADAAPVVEAHAETTREIEAADAAPYVREPEPAAGTREKGLAPFDEYSTVPASIQQRIASGDARERAAAIVELSHVDTDEAFQQICAAFDDQAREVRSAAARALYELRADRADSFTRALREATPERRREIGAAIATSGLAGESISQLTGESRERTYEAFSLLFLMAKAGEVQPLLRAIEGHPSNEVRLAVVKLLALSGQKEVLPAFRRLAVRGSLPTEVRSAVMEAIYQISSSQPTHA